MQMRVTKSKDDDDQIAGDKPGHSGARPQSDAGFFVSDKASDEGCEGAYIGYVTEQSEEADADRSEKDKSNAKAKKLRAKERSMKLKETPAGGKRGKS